MGITEILRRIWLFCENKIKSSEFFSKQLTQLIVKLNSSLQHIKDTQYFCRNHVKILQLTFVFCFFLGSRWLIFRAFGSAEVQKSGREFSHGLVFTPLTKKIWQHANPFDNFSICVSVSFCMFFPYPFIPAYSFIRELRLLLPIY